MPVSRSDAPADRSEHGSRRAWPLVIALAGAVACATSLALLRSRSGTQASAVAAWRPIPLGSPSAPFLDVDTDALLLMDPYHDALTRGESTAASSAKVA